MTRLDSLLPALPGRMGGLTAPMSHLYGEQIQPLRRRRDGTTACTRDPQLFDRPEGQPSDQVLLHDQDEDEDRDHGRDAQCGQIAPFRLERRGEG
jgi:hypothetical protein